MLNYVKSKRLKPICGEQTIESHHMSHRIEQCTRLKVSLRNKLSRVFDSAGVYKSLAWLPDRYDLADLGVD